VGLTGRAWQARGRITRARVWGVVLAALLAVAPAPGCGEAAPNGDADATVASEAPMNQLEVHTRDGVVTTTFPIDVVTQQFERSLAGTSADGGFRLYVEHRPPDKLVRVAGATKDALAARGWVVEAERHYEAAIEVRSSKGKGPSHITRVTWFVARGGRVVLCEGFARDSQKERLGEPLKRRCERLDVKPVENPKPVEGAKPN